MIRDLDSTVEELLRRGLPPELVSESATTPVTISFITPDDQFPPASVTPPAINLFLYDMRENRELRSNEWIIERSSDGSANRRQPPVRVNCAYLITAWASDSSTTPALDEHRLLGEVMKVLLRYPTIPEDMLQGELQQQEVPLPTTALQGGQLQSLAEFWQALGGKPKAALHYMVTISVDVHEPEITGPPVTDKRIPGQKDSS